LKIRDLNGVLFPSSPTHPSIVTLIVNRHFSWIIDDTSPSLICTYRTYDILSNTVFTSSRSFLVRCTRLHIYVTIQVRFVEYSLSVQCNERKSGITSSSIHRRTILISHKPVLRYKLRNKFYSYLHVINRRRLLEKAYFQLLFFRLTKFFTTDILSYEHKEENTNDVNVFSLQKIKIWCIMIIFPFTDIAFGAVIDIIKIFWSQNRSLIEKTGCPLIHASSYYCPLTAYSTLSNLTLNYYPHTSHNLIYNCNLIHRITWISIFLFHSWQNLYHNNVTNKSGTEFPAWDAFPERFSENSICGH
jgi:hypothetical protein